MPYQVVHTLPLVALLREVCCCRFRHYTRLKSQVEATISYGCWAEPEKLIVDILKALGRGLHCTSVVR